MEQGMPRKVYVWFSPHNAPYLDGGLKYLYDCLLAAFPDRTESLFSESLPTDLTEEDLVIPLIVPTVSELPPVLWTQLAATPATVIPYFIWECNYLTIDQYRAVGRADIIVCPSPFLTRLFPLHRTKVLPIPIKNLRYRGRKERTYRIGSILSGHLRKNHRDWKRLAQQLPPPWKIRILFNPKHLSFIPDHLHDLFSMENVEWVKGPVTDGELEDFYHSLDWYVSLSVGEGYDLPAREALKCGVPVLVPNHTAYQSFPEEGVVYYPTTDECGVEFQLPASRVRVPSLPDLVEILQRMEPPKVPQDLSLPTLDDWQKGWAEIYREARARVARLHSLEIRRRVIFLNDENYYCGLRAVSSIYAQRLNGTVFPIGDVCRFVFPSETVVVFPYTQGFLTRSGRVLTSALTLFRVRNSETPFFIWAHSAPLPEELSFFISLGAKFLVTSQPLQSFYPKAKVLPNPIGDPPRRDAHPNTVLFFSVVRQHFTDYINLFLTIVQYAPKFTFTFVIPTSPYEGNLTEFSLSLNHFIISLGVGGRVNWKIITEPKTDEELSLIHI